jgi:hypothetical protein
MQDFHHGGTDEGGLCHLPTGFGKVEQGKRTYLLTFLVKEKPDELF